MRKKKDWLIFWLLLLLSVWVLSFRLIKSPPILNQDEASIANESFSIANNLRSTQGKLLPVFFETLGERHDWKNPFPIYWVAVWVKVLGFSTYSTRLAMVGLALITIIFLWLIVGLIIPKNIWVQFLSCLFLLLSPLFLIQARQVIDPICLLPLLMMQIYCSIKYFLTKKNIFWYLSALAAGIGFYTYHPARLYAPLYFWLAGLVFFNWSKNERFRSIKLMIGSTLILAVIIAPAIYWNFFVQPGVLTERYMGMVGPMKWSELLMLPINYLRYFDFSFLFGTGDADILHSTFRAGVFPLVGIIILGMTVYGLSVNRFDKIKLFLLLSLGVYPLGLMITKDFYRACRGIYFIPIFVILMTYGFERLSKLNKWWKAIILTIFFIPSVLFLYDFYFLYPVRVRDDWRFREPLAKQIEYVVRDLKDFPEKIYIDSTIWFARDNLKYFENIHGVNPKVNFFDDLKVATQSGGLFLTDKINNPAKELPREIEIFSSYNGILILKVDAQK